MVKAVRRYTAVIIMRRIRNRNGFTLALRKVGKPCQNAPAAVRTGVRRVFALTRQFGVISFNRGVMLRKTDALLADNEKLSAPQA